MKILTVIQNDHFKYKITVKVCGIACSISLQDSVCSVKKISFRSSHPDVFFEEGVLKICSKFTGEHPCRSAISKKLLCKFFEIALRHGCSPVYLLYIFRTPFPKNTSGQLLLTCHLYHVCGEYCSGHSKYQERC